MTTNTYFYFFLLVLLNSCSRNKEIVFNERSFFLVNLNPEFPIIDFTHSSSQMDSMGLTCKRCISDEGKKLYLASAIIDRKKRSVKYNSLGWGASYLLKYDSNNRITNQVVSSCYTWKIDYIYGDKPGVIYQFSKEEYDNTADTTIYKLDSQGRVTGIEGIEYGDLYKRNVSKKIFYATLSSIPDSINSTYRRKYGIAEVRKEKFYQKNNKIDSIVVEVAKLDPNFQEKRQFINYFDRNGLFISQKTLYPKYVTEMFYVEKIR